MKMNLESLQDRKKWEEMGFKLPDYSVEKMILPITQSGYTLGQAIFSELCRL